MTAVENLGAALARATQAIEQGAGDEKPRLLERGGITIAEIDLTDADLVNGFKELKGAAGYGVRMLRHGSNPGARLELGFGGGVNKATKFFAPGQAVRGGFDTMAVKLAKGSARVGKATLALLNAPETDLSEDLIIGAIGPVDLLGTTDANGDPASWVTVAKATNPTGANPTGSFDGSGWELLRVLVDASAPANLTTADIVFWLTTSYAGTTWFECGLDGRFSIPDTDTSGGRYRAFTVPWAGRGMGYPAIPVMSGAGTGLNFIIQGLK